METCADCGFVYDDVDRGDVGPRLTSGAAAIAAILLAESTRSVVRPSPQRRSSLEYAAHVRDVLITLRDHMVIGLVEAIPAFKPMYRDERVDLGLYRNDPAANGGERAGTGGRDARPPVRRDQA